MEGSNAQAERLGQILDHLYVPPSGSDPEEAVAIVVDLTEDKARAGPDVSEETLVLARRGVRMAGRFVTLVPSLDPKQLGHIVPVDVATLDLYTRSKVAELIQTGYCFQPLPEVPLVAEGHEG